MNQMVISAKKVMKRFGQKTILEELDLEVEKGQICGIVGSNGSGKSVLLRILCGLIRPTSGEIYIHNEKLDKRHEFPRSTGILIDSPGLLLNESAFQNLYILAMVGGSTTTNRIEEVLLEVGLDPKDNRPVRVYSTGMRQRLGLAQAFMEEPELLILDEPTNGLDFKWQDGILAIFKELREKGKTLLITSHSREEIATLCDKVYLLAEGRLSEYQ